MKLTEQLKKEIDDMPYEDMLRRWRFAPVGEEMFQDESGEYFRKVMTTKKNASPSEAVRASKTVGWWD